MKLQIVKEFLAQVDKKIQDGDFCDDPEIEISEKTRHSSSNTNLQRITAYDKDRGEMMAQVEKTEFKRTEWRRI